MSDGKFIDRKFLFVSLNLYSNSICKQIIINRSINHSWSIQWFVILIKVMLMRFNFLNSSKFTFPNYQTTINYILFTNSWLFSLNTFFKGSAWKYKFAFNYVKGSVWKYKFALSYVSVDKICLKIHKCDGLKKFGRPVNMTLLETCVWLIPAVLLIFCICNCIKPTNFPPGM